VETENWDLDPSMQQQLRRFDHTKFWSWMKDADAETQKQPTHRVKQTNQPTKQPTIQEEMMNASPSE
jgi:hypothetical protein